MLHIAIIGTGNIAPAHINAYLAFPERCNNRRLGGYLPAEGTGDEGAVSSGRRCI